MTGSESVPRGNRPAELLREIERMEQRVMDAPNLAAARMYHDRLDALRARYAAARCNCCGRELGEAR